MDSPVFKVPFQSKPMLGMSKSMVLAPSPVARNLGTWTGRSIDSGYEEKTRRSGEPKPRINSFGSNQPRSERRIKSLKNNPESRLAHIKITVRRVQGLITDRRMSSMRLLATFQMAGQTFKVKSKKQGQNYEFKSVIFTQDRREKMLHLDLRDRHLLKQSEHLGKVQIGLVTADCNYVTTVPLQREVDGDLENAGSVELEIKVFSDDITLPPELSNKEEGSTEEKGGLWRITKKTRKSAEPTDEDRSENLDLDLPIDSSKSFKKLTRRTC